MPGTDPEEHDAVDRIVAQWARERPELDTGPMAVIGRLHRLGDLLEAELRTVFAEAGLGNGDFDVLATLRRAGAPFRLSPGELSASTMVTVGRGDQAGRPPRRRRAWSSGPVSAADGRGREIQLTPQGRRADRRARRTPLGQRGPPARRARPRRAACSWPDCSARLLLDVEGPTAGPVDAELVRTR